MENKRFRDLNAAPRKSETSLKAALVGRNETQCIEVQAALAGLAEIAVEAVPSLSLLAVAFHADGKTPDVVLIDIDPDQPQDVLLLQDLRKFVHDTPIVAVTDRVTDHGPLRAMRAGANDVLLKPVNLDDARDVFERIRHIPKRRAAEPPSLGKVIVFMHLSGGAGATTLAVNSACALTGNLERKQACLIDLDVQFGNAATLLDLGASPVQEFFDDPRRLDFEMLDGLLLKHATGLNVLTAPRRLVPVTAYTLEGVELLIELARRRFGYVVVDLPIAFTPWTDGVLRTASVINLVLPLSVPSVHRLTKFLELLREEHLTDLPLRLIINRHRRDNPGSDITLAQFEKAIGRKPDFVVPNDYSLVSTSHGQGKPAIVLKPGSPFADSIKSLLNGELGETIFERPRRGFSFLRRGE